MDHVITRMRQWADGSPGRIITWPDPDAYVLVDGVLLRAHPHSPGLAPGADVEVRLDPAQQRLIAYESGTGH
ncbi:hypothetical protein LHJ74_17000 [Streptomyces sp. N2-109]|uniref:Uncharacterized protein n=1 Tax=Streptomyces gossypii TaxID=2883101 RepID=A0ABT2JUL7_9ACTN|nr:hypothetical protein [Streptomyces gossypii]MCT2591576.1 hypothetical protein [Streptomyces gossypii]